MVTFFLQNVDYIFNLFEYFANYNLHNHLQSTLDTTNYFHIISEINNVLRRLVISVYLTNE